VPEENGHFILKNSKSRKPSLPAIGNLGSQEKSCPEPARKLRAARYYIRDEEMFQPVFIVPWQLPLLKNSRSS